VLRIQNLKHILNSGRYIKSINTVILIVIYHRQSRVNSTCSLRRMSWTKENAFIAAPSSWSANSDNILSRCMKCSVLHKGDGFHCDYFIYIYIYIRLLVRLERNVGKSLEVSAKAYITIGEIFYWILRRFLTSNISKYNYYLCRFNSGFLRFTIHMFVSYILTAISYLFISKNSTEPFSVANAFLFLTQFNIQCIFWSVLCTIPSLFHLSTHICFLFYFDLISCFLSHYLYKIKEFIVPLSHEFCYCFVRDFLFHTFIISAFSSLNTNTVSHISCNFSLMPITYAHSTRISSMRVFDLIQQH
jgi:hypothetical protein